VHHLGVSSGIGRRQTAVISGEKELADLFVDAHFLQCGFDPLAGFGREPLSCRIFYGGMLRSVRNFGGGVGHKNDQCGRYEK
jgi:hypothetical protein